MHYCTYNDGGQSPKDEAEGTQSDLTDIYLMLELQNSTKLAGYEHLKSYQKNKDAITITVRIIFIYSREMWRTPGVRGHWFLFLTVGDGYTMFAS